MLWMGSLVANWIIYYLTHRCSCGINLTPRLIFVHLGSCSVCLCFCDRCVSRLRNAKCEQSTTSVGELLLPPSHHTLLPLPVGHSLHERLCMLLLKCIMYWPTVFVLYLPNIGAVILNIYRICCIT